jgi:hypothetical protein
MAGIRRSKGLVGAGRGGWLTRGLLASAFATLSLLASMAVPVGASASSAPTITSLEPNNGPTSGGTTVIIHGEPLENARSVHFGSVEGKIIEEECGGLCEIMPYRTLVVESPPHAAGTVDVTVETDGGVSLPTPGDEFTYSPPAAKAPAIDSVSISHLTSTDATLQAQIDTEGLPTSYEFLMRYEECAICEDFQPKIEVHLPSARLDGSFVDQLVSLDLNSAGVALRSGPAYEYSVRATNAVGSTEAKWQRFVDPLGGVFEPAGTTTSSPSATGQPGGGASSGDQLAGPGTSSSSSSSALGVRPFGSPLGKTTMLKPLANAQKLSKALKACERKPKKQWANCAAHARKQYGAAGKTANKKK